MEAHLICRAITDKQGKRELFLSLKAIYDGKANTVLEAKK